MRVGGFPGQRAALQRRVDEIRQEGKELASRRTFLGLAVGGVSGALSGGAAGYLLSGSRDDRQPPEPRATPSPPGHTWAHRVALGPLKDLLAGMPTFLSVVEQSTEGDPVLWAGVSRLVHFAAENRTAEADLLRRRLRFLQRVRTPPAMLAPTFQLLRRR